jgi:hypothetical protein
MARTAGSQAGVRERRDPRVTARGRGLAPTGRLAATLLARPGRALGVDAAALQTAPAQSIRDPGDVAALASGPPGRHRPGTPPRGADVATVPVGAGRGDCGVRLLPCRHGLAQAPVCIVHDGAGDPPGSCPRRHGRTRPERGWPNRPATCSCTSRTALSRSSLGSSSATETRSSPTPSMRSSPPRPSESCGRLCVRRERMPSPNAGSAPYVVSCSTGC